VTADEEVRAVFERGAPKRLADLGGAGFLRGREEDLSRAALMPELLSLALAEAPSGEAPVHNFVVACAGAPVGPEAVRASDYKDAMEALVAVALPEDLAERCQDVLVGRAFRRADHDVARWVALGASLQIAIEHPDLRHGLIGALVRLKPEGSPPEFLRRAAKVTGVALSHWPDPSLVRILESLSRDEGARDEALFELGMAALRDGLEAEAPGEVDRWFEAARDHFTMSVSARENRPDARTYSTALSLLNGLRRGDPAEALRGHAETIRREVTMARAWSQPTRPTWRWMGARWTEIVRWQDLATEAAAIDEAADAAAQAGAEIAIRRRLLGAYVANRSVLGRGPGGVETFARPRIEARLLREEAGREAVMAWLATEEATPYSPWREAAAEMLAELRARGAPVGKQMGAADPA